MYFAFLHGEYLVFGMLLVGLLFWSSVLALFVWKWRYISQHKFLVAVVYLLLVAVSCLLLLSDEGGFFGFILANGLTLPWTLVVPQLLGVDGDSAYAASLFLCGVINAVLFYFLARLLMKRLSDTRNAAG